jgi:hypothetical protein
LVLGTVFVKPGFVIVERQFDQKFCQTLEIHVCFLGLE